MKEVINIELLREYYGKKTKYLVFLLWLSI